MSFFESPEKKGARDLLYNKNLFLLSRRRTHFLLVSYHLPSLTRCGLDIKPYFQTSSYKKIGSGRKPDRVLYPIANTHWRERKSSQRPWWYWVRSNPHTPTEVFAEGGQWLQQSVQAWPSTMEELAQDSIQTFLILEWKTLLASCVSSSRIIAFCCCRKQHG